MNISIYRQGNILKTVTLESGSTLKRVLMGEETVTLQFSLDSFIGFTIGDTISYNSQPYTINSSPQIKKITGRNYRYTVVFESIMYNLLRTAFLFYDSDGIMQEGNFSFNGLPGNFMDLILKNLNRFQSGWHNPGTIAAIGSINITFANDTCTSAMTKIAQAFGTEWYVYGQQIYLQKKVLPSQATFSYGSGQGLYEITRQQNGTSGLVTRLYLYGSDKNINPAVYGYKFLTIPGGNRFIDSGVQKYGIFEAEKVFNDIFPHRVGIVTAGDGINPLIFADASMDFSPADYYLSGMTPQINFLTGQLAGYTFDLANYNPTNFQFNINGVKSDTNTSVPNLQIHAVPGDRYVILGITMPDSYIATAQALLMQQGLDYLRVNSAPQITYSVSVDPIWVSQNGFAFDSGSQLTLVDTDMGINTVLRILGIQLDLTQAGKYTLTLGDAVTLSLAQRIVANTASALNTANAGLKLAATSSATDVTARLAAQTAQAAAVAAQKASDLAAAAATLATSTSGYASTAAQSALTAAQAAAQAAAEAKAAAASQLSVYNAFVSSIAYVTNDLSTSVRGGLITSSILEVGPGDQNGKTNAGISGAGVTSSQVRFWAGSTYENSSSAPFRVQQDGTVFMAAANIANSCTVGDFTIANGGLTDSSGLAYLSLVNSNFNVGFGVTGVVQSGGQNCTGLIQINYPTSQKQNIALILRAANSTAYFEDGSNIALYVPSGNVVLEATSNMYARGSIISTGKITANLPTFTGNYGYGSGYGQVFVKISTGQLYYYDTPEPPTGM